MSAVLNADLSADLMQNSSQILTDVSTIPSEDLKNWFWSGIRTFDWTTWFRFQLVLISLTLHFCDVTQYFSVEALSSFKIQLTVGPELDCN